MLVVMTIMLILVAVALPTIKNSMQDGSTREASRQLNAYFAMAKARALQTGRPCGVMMLCDLPPGLSEPGAGFNGMPLWPTKTITKLYLAEVPPPYSGSLIGSRGRIIFTNSPANTLAEFIPMYNGAADNSEYAVINSLIPDGEAFYVRFDFKGPWYLCQRRDAPTGTHYFYQFLTQAGTTLPLPPGIALVAGSVPGYSYQIIRLPRRIGNALELPTGTCIDVAYSGIGPTDLPSGPNWGLAYGMYPDPSTTSPPPGIAPLRRITVMFLPDGGIESIYLNDTPFQPSTTAHFLVGRSDKINPNSTTPGSSTTHPSTIAMYDPALSNLADPLSLWVSISRSTGNVVTSDNQPPVIDPSTASTAQINLIIGGQAQPMNPQQPNSQTIYLSYCRLLATNREQAKTE